MTVRNRHRVQVSSPLPWTYWLHGLIQQCEPSGVVEPLDYGGVRSAAVPLISLDVSTWTGTFYRFQGLDAGDPYRPGRPLLIPAVEDLEAVRVAPYAAAAGARAYAGEIDMRLRDFGSAMNLELSTFDTGGALHARSPAPAERLRYFTRDRVALTSRLGESAAFLLTAAGQWSGTQEVDARLLFGNAWMQYRLPRNGELSGGFTGTWLRLSGGAVPAGFQPLASRPMSPPLLPSPLLGQRDHLEALQRAWTRAAAVVRYGYTTGRLKTEPRREALDSMQAPRIDLLSGEVDGAPALWNKAARRRHEIAATYRRNGLSLAGGWQTAEAVNRLRVPTGMHILTLAGVPEIFARFHPDTRFIRLSIGHSRRARQTPRTCAPAAAR